MSGTVLDAICNTPIECEGGGGSVSLRPQPVRPQLTHNPYKEPAMAENVYKVIELVGTSPESWEKAAAAAVKRAGKTLRDLRVAEISQLDMQLKDEIGRAHV